MLGKQYDHKPCNIKMSRLLANNANNIISYALMKTNRGFTTLQ